MAETEPRAAISDEEVSALLEKNSADGVRPYDFTSQRINRMQLPLLEVVCKSFAERAGAAAAEIDVQAFFDDIKNFIDHKPHMLVLIGEDQNRL